MWPEDLHTRRWFPRGLQRTRISTLPTDVQFSLPNNYSIITSRCSPTASVNRAMHNLLGIRIRGHVLVIRHGARNIMQVTNVLRAEHRFIDVLIRRYVLSYDTTTSAHSSQSFQPDSNRVDQLSHRMVSRALGVATISRCLCIHVETRFLHISTVRSLGSTNTYAANMLLNTVSLVSLRA